MQPRIPRQSADDRAEHRPGDDARLSAELAAVVSGARRRALRDGDRQIDTAHLLHTLLESDPEVRAVFGDGPQTARLLGYLVQRSIGYGLRWQGMIEDSGPMPVVGDGDAVPVEPVEHVENTVKHVENTVKETEAFSPLAAGALEHACVLAGRRGADLARGVDLLAAIVVDPLARAVEVLARAGIAAGELAARLKPVVEGDQPAGVQDGAEDRLEEPSR